MPGLLRQSTASQSRALGPFLDSGDFITPETGLTIANTDIKLLANGGASADKNSGGGTHRVNGYYGVTFDATDSATVGELAVSVVVAGALPVFDKFTVVEPAVYDALYADGAPGFATVAALAAAQAAIDAVAAKTTNLPTDPADQSLVIAATDAIVTALAAQNNLSTAQVLTQINAALDTVLSATIPADGTRPTLRQGVYMTTQYLLERTVAGTTVTVKNPDGTTLLTLLLGDATTPLSITRAT